MSYYKDTVLGDGPVAYWRLGETSGSAAKDERGLQDGTYTGTITLGAPGLLTGDPDKAATFAVSPGGFVSLGNRAEFQLGKGTAEAWIKTSTPMPNYGGIVIKQNAFGMFVDPSGILIGYDWVAATVTSSGINVVDGQRHHVALVFENGVGLTVYVDGVARASTPTFTVYDQTLELEIGRGGPYGGGTSQIFNGVIDEVALYGAKLTPARILAHYNAGLSSGAQAVSPGVINTAQAFGVVTIQARVKPAAGGVPSAQAFGAAKSRIAFQVLGVTSAQSFGTQRIPLRLTVSGLDSAQQFGQPWAGRRRLFPLGCVVSSEPPICGLVTSGDGHVCGGLSLIETTDATTLSLASLACLASMETPVCGLVTCGDGSICGGLSLIDTLDESERVLQPLGVF